MSANGDDGSVPRSFMDQLADISTVEKLEERVDQVSRRTADVGIQHRALARKVDKALYGLAGVRLLTAALVVAIPLLVGMMPRLIEASVESALIKHGVLKVQIATKGTP